MKKRCRVRQFLHNHVLRSPLSGRLYFVKRAEIMPGGVLLVRGEKVDVTESLQPYLLKRYRAKP